MYFDNARLFAATLFLGSFTLILGDVTNISALCMFAVLDETAPWALASM